MIPNEHIKGGSIFKGFLNISYPSQLVESTLTVQPTILHHLLLPCTIHHDKKNWAPWPGGPPHRLAKDFQLVQVPQESEVCQHFQPVWLYSKIITNIKETPPGDATNAQWTTGPFTIKLFLLFEDGVGGIYFQFQHRVNF